MIWKGKIFYYFSTSFDLNTLLYVRTKAIQNVFISCHFLTKFLEETTKKKEQKEQPVKKAPETADAKMLKI